MKTINLKSPVTVSITDYPSFPDQPEPPSREVTISSLTLRAVIDDATHKLVMATFSETRFPVVIWKGEAYDSAGEWTQAQIEQAVLEAVELDATGIVNAALQFPSIRK